MIRRGETATRPIAKQRSVVVIGGGPVGLCTSIALAQRGFRVQVVEARDGDGLDKACGEGLMPDALAALGELGISLDDIGVPLRGIRYLDTDSRAEAKFPGASGRGVRRVELHRRLSEAVAANSEIERLTGWRAKVIHLQEGARGEAAEPPNQASSQPAKESPVGESPAARPTRTAAHRQPIFGVTLQSVNKTVPQAAQTTQTILTPDWIVAADGLRSPARRAAGLDAAAGRLRFGARVHFAVAPWTRHVEVYWQEGQEAYLTPAGPQQVGLALLWRESHRGNLGERLKFEQRLESLWRSFPELAQRLANAPRSSSVRGIGPLRQPTRGVWRGNLALVGDASGYLDAITGEGLALGFADALAVTDALSQADLRSYARWHRRHRRVPVALIQATLLLARWPRLRRRVLAVMQRDPRLFARLLALHVGAASAPRTLLATSGMLVRGLLGARSPRTAPRSS